ncbi:hypothetical protein HNQ08_004378 [Deinococcus humi]|uniref:Uncharacterized protein n=1 Tax=Deinococcus humi TaxID=662880 RepID=A0A7W8JXX0_9DEIO|nr:hypothetical protein [Deinococcus humi]
MDRKLEDTTPLGRSVEEIEYGAGQPSQAQGGLLTGILHPTPASEHIDFDGTPSLGQVLTHSLGMDYSEPENEDADKGTTDSSGA